MSKPARCRSCEAVIFWKKTKNGKPIPCDPAPDGTEPVGDVFNSTHMTSHFATCPNAGAHRHAPKRESVRPKTRLERTREGITEAIKRAAEEYVLKDSEVCRLIEELSRRVDYVGAHKPYHYARDGARGRPEPMSPV